MSVDLQAEADQLRNRLATAEERVSRLEATNARLSTDLQAFRAAASSATDAARQNLEAVESRVEALTAVLTATPAAPGPEAALDRLISETGQSETDQEETVLAASAEPAADGQSAGVNVIAASQPLGRAALTLTSLTAMGSPSPVSSTASRTSNSSAFEATRSSC